MVGRGGAWLVVVVVAVVVAASRPVSTIRARRLVPEAPPSYN